MWNRIWATTIRREHDQKGEDDIYNIKKKQWHVLHQVYLYHVKTIAVHELFLLPTLLLYQVFIHIILPTSVYWVYVSLYKNTLPDTYGCTCDFISGRSSDFIFGPVQNQKNGRKTRNAPNFVHHMQLNRQGPTSPRPHFSPWVAWENRTWHRQLLS